MNDQYLEEEKKGLVVQSQNWKKMFENQVKDENKGGMLDMMKSVARNRDSVFGDDVKRNSLFVISQLDGPQ